MGTLGVVVGDPRGDLRSRMGQSEEQALIQQLVAHAAVEAFAKPFCIGLPGAM